MLAEPVKVRLRYARLAAGLTQPQLAEAVGTNRIQMVHWEAGRSRPMLHYRVAIAKETGFPLRFFDHDGRGGTS